MLVFGSGTMGLLIAVVCKLRGASRVVIADPAAGKLELSRRVGIEEAVTLDSLGEDCFDVVFEAAGVRSALVQGVTLVEKTGVLVQVGVHDADKEIGFNPFNIYEREIRIIGSNSCANKFLEAVDVMADIKAQAAVLIGTSYSVWDFDKAVDGMAAGLSIKTQLTF